MTCLHLVTASLCALPLAATIEKAKEDQTARACRSILYACEAYQAHPQNKTGAYPPKLADLVKPPFGGASFLRNGKDDLIDPWGNAYRYAVEKDKKGVPRVFVWTTRTIDGKTKTIGELPPAS